MKTKQSKWLSLLLVLAMALTLLPGAALAAEDPAEDDVIPDIMEVAAEDGETLPADNDEAANAGTDAPAEPSEDAQPAPAAEPATAAEPQEPVAAPPADNGIVTVVAEDAASTPAALEATESNQGTIEKITDVAVVDGDTISVSGSTLDWVSADASIGRWQDGWWVGFKIVAPASVTSSNVNNVKYSSDGTETLAKDFGQNNDGTTSDNKYYMGCWLPVQPGYLATALEKGSNLQWIYKFDWDGDNKVDQTLIATVDPNNITLNKDSKVYCKTDSGVMTYNGGGAVVATIASLGYTTVQAAVNAAADGTATTINVVADTTEDVTVPSGKNITLNLAAGVTLTNSSSDTITVKSSANLIITGSGTVDNKTNGKAAIFNEGTVILNGGIYDRTSETGQSADVSGGNSWYTICNHGTMTINAGVTVKNTGSFSSMIENGYYSYNSNNTRNGYVSGTNAANPSLTINGGTFTGGLNTVKNDDGGKLTITGGDFSNTAQAAVLNWNVAEISGGNFVVTTDYSVVLNGRDDNNKSGDEVLNQGKLTITGGTFTAKDGKEAIGMMNGNANMEAVSISGGMFSDKVKEDYCATGYHPTEADADGWYTVCNHTSTSLTEVPAKAATCTEDGYQAYWECKTCGHYFSDKDGTNEITVPTVIDATGHDLTAVPKKEATCTEAGNVAYWECETCHKLFSDKDGAKEFEGATGIPATGHNYQMKFDANGHWQECAGCGEKINNSVHTFTDWEVTDEPTEDKTGERTHRCEVCGYQESDEIPKIDSSVIAQVVPEKLDVVPEGLADKFESVEDIENALLAVSVTEANGYTAEKTEFYDVKLQISTDGGISWFDATEDNFPEGGITVILPYPEGTGKDTHDFVVTHMFGTTSEKLGTKAGETETPKVTKTDDGIQVTLKGLSPVSVSWKDVVKAPPAGEKDTQTPSPTPKAPPTGDNANIGLWAALLAVCALGAGAVLVLGRKRQSR